MGHQAPLAIQPTMIGFIALLVAFLTLLNPAARPAQGPLGSTDSSAGTAKAAGGGALTEGLIGSWEARVVFPWEGDGTPTVKTTELHIIELEPGSRSGHGEVGIAFGPEGERWHGALQASGAPGAVVFVGHALCSVHEGSVAAISGKLVDGCLSGTLLLDDQPGLLTWSCARRGASRLITG